MTATLGRTPEQRAEHARRKNHEWRRARGIPPRPTRHLSLQPILDAVADRPGINGLTGRLRVAAENRELGINRGQRKRWLDGGMDVYSLDRVCVAAGLHPAQVIGHAWHALDDLEEDEA